MTTTISKKFEINEPIEKVWAYLTNPEKIVTCVPGASLREKIDDRNYKGGVTLKFGPVKAKYNGEITFEEIDEVGRKMTLKGKGLDAKGTGSADMLMKSNLAATSGGTEVDCSMQISIVGKLAQFGARLINDVSDQIFNQFINNFKAKLAEDTSFESASASNAIVENTMVATAKNQAMKVVEEVVEKAQEAKTAVTASVEKVSAEIKNEVKESAVKFETPKTETDNSLNAFSLMLAVVKGWFSRLFGGK